MKQLVHWICQPRLTNPCQSLRTTMQTRIAQLTFTRGLVQTKRDSTSIPVKIPTRVAVSGRSYMLVSAPMRLIFAASVMICGCELILFWAGIRPGRSEWVVFPLLTQWQK